MAVCLDHHWDPQDWVDEAIYLVPHDPRWDDAYARISWALEELLRPWLTGGLHHVGSTAVPSISAKPVVDILAGVSSLDESRSSIEILREAAWWYAPYRPESMHWFCWPSPDHRQFHLHVAPMGGRWFTEELLFRDVLVRDSQLSRNTRRSRFRRPPSSRMTERPTQKARPRKSQKFWTRRRISEAVADPEVAPAIGLELSGSPHE